MWGILHNTNTKQLSLTVHMYCADTTISLANNKNETGLKQTIKTATNLHPEGGDVWDFTTSSEVLV
jgi:hypothetical protein